jgi:uncharacterized damage-inducible protein DinB
MRDVMSRTRREALRRVGLVSASDAASPAELIASLAGMPARLEAAVAALGAREAAPGVDGWSARELAGHLCDAARVWGARMRVAALEERPHLELYDQEAFVRLGAYRYIPSGELARQFRTISEPTVAFLRGLDAGAWERIAIHDEFGALTLREIVVIEVDHEREHVGQIEGMARQA